MQFSTFRFCHKPEGYRMLALHIHLDHLVFFDVHVSLSTEAFLLSCPLRMLLPQFGILPWKHTVNFETVTLCTVQASPLYSERTTIVYSNAKQLKFCLFKSTVLSKSENISLPVYCQVISKLPNFSNSNNDFSPFSTLAFQGSARQRKKLVRTFLARNSLSNLSGIQADIYLGECQCSPVIVRTDSLEMLQCCHTEVGQDFVDIFVCLWFILVSVLLSLCSSLFFFACLLSFSLLLFLFYFSFSFPVMQGSKPGALI